MTAVFMTAVLLWQIPLFAQEPDESPAQRNQIREIEEASEGNVTFDIPQRIADKILADPPKPRHRQQENRPTHQSSRPSIHKRQGYRIQVFSDGRNQHSLESRAKARGNAIVAKFPKYRGQVYSFSSSPNWYTRVGNFSTSSEASKALAELKRAFPSFAGEMRIVKCQIVIIK